MINIVVADDHEIVREGLVQILSKDPYINVVGQANDGMEAVKKCRRLKPQVLVMDISMPTLNGIEAAKQIITSHQNTSITKIILLSMHTDNDTIMRAMDAGISGYLLKTGPAKELIEAIKTVAKGHSYLTPEISTKVMNLFQKNRTTPTSPALDNLTPKERHVLQLIAEGHSSKEIAFLLHVSFHTVKTHRNHIMEKLELHNVAELTRFAVENKLTQPNHH